MNHFPVCPYLPVEPDIHPEAFVAPTADVVGDVVLAAGASIWYGAILRADIQKIVIGEGPNIQDGCVVHLSSEQGTVVGRHVTVGHKAILHACRIGDEVLVGMGAIVMDGADIGDRCLIAAGAVVTPGTIVPPGSMVAGIPARVVRPLSGEEQKKLRGWAEKYIQVAREHRQFLAERRSPESDQT